jgi:hypothetical protein
MSHARQSGGLDATTLAQLTSRFDPLPGEAPAGESTDDFAALRAVLERDGRFCPRPPEPLWADPRPDLTGDHGRWTVLLALAWAVDGPDPYGVYGALQGVRCCGAALLTEAQPLDLTPVGPPLRWRLTRGEIPEPEWPAYRARWLWPHKENLIKLLQGGREA